MRMQDAKIYGVFLLLLLVTVSPSWAEETVEIGEVVVTASKIAEPVGEATSDVIVITAEDIKSSGAQFLPDILRTVPELNVVQSGGTGTTASVFLRGGDSKHTLVLIDGVRMNDPASGLFDFSGLPIDDIERIEIVKGPQGTLYGSDAMAGVINIITKKGKPGFNFDASFEGGSFGTYKPALSISGGSGSLDYRLTASYFKTDGISQAASGAEEDGYENASFSGKLGYAFSKNNAVELNGRYSTGSNDLDAFGADDLDDTQKKDNYLISAKGTTYLREEWEQILTVSTLQDTLDYDAPDPAFPQSTQAETGKKIADWQNNVYSGPNVLTVGLEYREENGKDTNTQDGTVNFEEAIDNKAAYASTKVLKEELTLSAGVRYDVHETAGEKMTWRIGASEHRKASGWTFKASYGTGFRAPTLNELFFKDPWGSTGNPDLKPEESTSWEVGVGKDISPLSVSATYFNQSYKNLIQWEEAATWVWQPQNTAEAAIWGVETDVAYKLTSALGLSAGYTYLNTEDKETGERLARRPRDKATVAASYSGESLSLVADFLYVGERFDKPVVTTDTEADKKDKTLNSYYTVNLGGSFKVTNNFSLTARVENLLDDKYEESGGYGVPGRAYYAGIRASF